MLTIDKLRDYGADVDIGLERCINEEDFYLEMVDTAIADTRINDLEEQINAGNLDEAFATAHSLKGIYGNLSITPLYDPISKVTELLRAKTQTDYSVYINELKEKFAQLVGLAESD